MKIDQNIPTRRVQQTGIYVGPGGDSRYIKAGSDVATTYTFSHEPGAKPAPAADTKKPA